MKDLTKDYDYEQLIQEEKEHYSRIEVTEDLREGGLHDCDSWHYYWRRVGLAVHRPPFENLPSYLGRTFSDLGRPLRVLSLGSGYCGHEIALSEGLLALGLEHRITCTDINEDIFQEAKRITAERGLSLDFAVEDLNFIRIEPRHYDLIFAHASLHHVINLEQLFEQMLGGLAEGGLFHFVEVVGKNRKLIWDENERLANLLLSAVPDEITQGVRLAVPEEADGMEGIRQEDLLALLREHFEPVVEHTHGAFMRFICTHHQLSQAFDPNDEERRRYLDFLIDADNSAVRRGILRPLEIWGVYKPRAGRPDS
jgi:SAM-dependent methyltransferase